jgi:phage major head subunit gpT-like protein
MSMQTQSKGSTEVYDFDGGLPQLREWIGERQIQALKIYEQTIRNRTYELTFKVPVEHFEDDSLGLFNARVQQLGVAAKVHPDSLLADLLHDGFSAGKGYDDVAFFSASHPRSKGLAAQSNRVTGALTSTTFNTAIKQMRQLTNHQGEKLDLMAMGGELTLTVAPNLESTARGILLAQYGSGGASNTDYGRAKLQVFNRLNDGFWFVHLSGAPTGGFIHQMRRQPRIVARDQPSDDAMWTRNEVEFGVDGRWALGYGLWQCIQGSNGA